MPVCCCFGSHFFLNGEETEKRFIVEATKVIEALDITEFHIADHGNSATMFASCLQKMKAKYPNIKVVRVLAYIKEKPDEYEEDLNKIFDESIYPDLETTPKRLAIVKRNHIMLNYADFIIFNCGDIRNTKNLKYLTIQKKKPFVEIGDF